MNKLRVSAPRHVFSSYELLESPIKSTEYLFRLSAYSYAHNFRSIIPRLHVDLTDELMKVNLLFTKSGAWVADQREES